MRLILASGSPRRLDILSRFGLRPEVIVPKIDEQAIVAAWDGSDVGSLVCELALAKACAVYEDIRKQYEDANEYHKGTCEHYESIYERAAGLGKDVISEQISEFNIILAADIIVYNGQTLGKPKNEAEALAMLMSLCAQTHQVYTGCVLLNCSSGRIIYQNSVCTEVEFANYSREQALDYIRAEQPFDKAGGYAIQGSWRREVVNIQGDYNNVVGLPTAIAQMLARILHDSDSNHCI
jgi:septum formation protein